MNNRISSVVDNGTFDDVISSASPIVQAIARKTRMLIADVQPGVTEVPWVGQKTVGYGADLDDPQDLLDGTGKLLRHIKLRSQEDLDNPAIRRLLSQASKYLPKLGKPRSTA